MEVTKDKFRHSLSKLRKSVVRTLIVTSLLVLLNYFWSNIGVSFFNDTLVIKFVNAFLVKENIPDDVFLVDVQFDLELAEVEKDNFPIGNVAVTDRKKVYEFLHKLDSTGTYNYIFMDIGFWKGIETDSDSLLFNQIRSMPRIVIADSDEMDSNLDLDAKSGGVDYYTTFLNTDFNKYQITDFDGRYSMAGRAYEELTGRSVWSLLSILCFDRDTTGRDRVAFRCISPKPRLFFSANDSGEKNKDVFDKQLKKIQVHPLGSDVLCNYDAYYVTDEKDAFENRNILIGNFSEIDSHETVYGKTYGCILNYDAFLALLNSDHIFRWYQFLIMFAGIYILTFVSELRIGVRKSNSLTWLNAIVEFIPAWAMAILTYLLVGNTFNFLLVAIMLSIYSYIYNITHPDEKNN